MSRQGVAEPPKSGFRLSFDRGFVAALCTTAVPVALQSMISSSRTVVDSFLVAQLGTAEIAAVGYASRAIFVIMLATLGMADGAAVVVAQFWGSGSVEKTRQATALTVAVASAVALVSGVACYVWAGEIVALGTEDPAVISLASGYIRTVVAMIVPYAVISALAASLRCSGDAKVAMRFAFVGLVLHVVLAYGLIFGNWGLPALGLTGAALATVISAYLECLAFVLYVYGKRHPMAFRWRDLRNGVRDNILKKIRTVGVPVSVSSVVWAIGILVYSILVGRTGTQELAVLSMITPIESLAIAVANGVATAASVIIGNSIGEGADERRTWSLSKALLIWTAGIGTVLGLVLLSARWWLGEVYGGVDDTSIAVARDTMFVLAAVFVFRALSMTLQNGLLRAGGDTVYILWADLSCAWLVAIPLTFLTGLVWGLPFPIVFLAINSEEIARTVISGYRVYRRRWMRSLVS